MANPDKEMNPTIIHAAGSVTTFGVFPTRNEKGTPVQWTLKDLADHKRSKQFTGEANSGQAAVSDALSGGSLIEKLKEHFSQKK